jgi:hypothetical protein
VGIWPRAAKRNVRPAKAEMAFELGRGILRYLGKQTSSGL